MSRTWIHLTLCALLSAAWLTPLPGVAQTAPFRLQERAQQPITGPGTLLGVGLTLMVAAPIVSLSLAFGGLHNSGGWLCEDDCPSRSHGEGAIASGIVLTAAGAALTAYGMTRVIQIRSARRRLAKLEGVGAAITPQSAQLGFRFRF